MVQVSYFTKGHTDDIRSNDKFITNHVILPQKINCNSSKKIWLPLIKENAIYTSELVSELQGKK